MWPAKSLFDTFPIPDRYPDHESYYFFNDNDQETFDVYEMFRFYDMYFFHDKLVACQVKWSSRMTLCAGTCQMDFPGSCTITLSKPLLQFRTNNNLKETLIHEMIHAYLFITDPRSCHDRGGHGKEFCEIMDNINSISGLNISVYHTFHDEVDYFRKHIWRCSGPCQTQAPFFGYVKRAMNRAPGPKDPWWEQHAKKCGGAYTKIDGPEFHEDLSQKKISKKGSKSDGGVMIDEGKRVKKTKRSENDESRENIMKYLKKVKTSGTMEEEDEPRVYLYMITKENQNSNPQPGRNQNDLHMRDQKNENMCPDIIELSDNSLSNQENKTPLDDQKIIAEEKDLQKDLTKPIKRPTGDVKDYFKDIFSQRIPKGNINSVSSISQVIREQKNETFFDSPFKDGFVSADKLIATPTKSEQSVITPSKLGSEVVYGFVISRENNPYLTNFWARVLISSRRTLNELLRLSMLVMPIEFPDERILVYQDKIMTVFEDELGEIGFKQGALLQDEVNDISFRLEKIFYLDKLSNAKVLQAKEVPVCIGAAFFKENGGVIEGNKEKMEIINKDILREL